MPLPTTIRSLIRARVLSTTTVLTLALGIAALTITFGIVHAALIRQPPFAHAGRLVMLYLQRVPRDEPPYRERWSFARFELLRQSQDIFDDVAS